MKKYILIFLATILGIISLIVVLRRLVITYREKETAARAVSNAEIRNSIKEFADLMDAETYKDFGFTSIAEVSSFKPGQQFRFYTMGLNDIKKYQAGEDISKMIKEYPAVEVSLTDSLGKMRTSIKFVVNGKNWEAVRFGYTPGMVTLSLAQTILPDSVISKGRLIRIPFLETSFLAMPAAADMTFYILDDNPIWGGLKPGDKIPAKEAMLKFLPFVNKQISLQTKKS